MMLCIWFGKLLFVKFIKLGCILIRKEDINGVFD